MNTRTNRSKKEAADCEATKDFCLSFTKDDLTGISVSILNCAKKRKPYNDLLV